MKLWLIVLFVLVLAGCAHPPQLATSLDLRKDAGGAILVKLKVTNLEDRVTVPISIDLTAESETNGHWEKPFTLLHPAAFVLNRKEQREITKEWKIAADAVRTKLVVREQETGNLLKSEGFEQRGFAAAK